MTQLTLDVAPTPTELGIKRCVECGQPYRDHGFDGVPIYTLNRLLMSEFPEPSGTCPECRSER